MLLERLNTVCLWLETFREISKTKLSDIPQFVAEFTISNDTLYIQVDRALYHVGEQSETKTISSTFGDSVGEVLCLLLNGLGNFTLRQVGSMKLLQKRLKIAAIENLKWINDITLRFRHLGSIFVLDHRVQEYCLERQLIRQF